MQEYRQNLLKGVIFCLMGLFGEAVVLGIGGRKKRLSKPVIVSCLIGINAFVAAIMGRLVLLQVALNPDSYQQHLGLPITRFLEKGVKKKVDSGYFAFPREKRFEIVIDYRRAREKGEVRNKHRWAQEKYNISGKTLSSYEKEYDEYMEVNGNK